MPSRRRRIDVATSEPLSTGRDFHFRYIYDRPKSLSNRKDVPPEERATFQKGMTTVPGLDTYHFGCVTCINEEPLTSYCVL
ncbi:hypothetical protein Trydic_g22115 [Trypoxylus dichotomus]